ncbi:MAG: hypothetical protein DMG89_19825 [Acidobacteria bacterium]|nr:MAG: hypothetical protein DMG89_19825 [Acidobacteriota bacterium]
MIVDSKALQRDGQSTQASSNPSPPDVDLELQKALHVALELLLMLCRLDDDPRESPLIRRDITALAQWMDFLCQQRERTATDNLEQRFHLVKFGGQMVCQPCRKSAKENARRPDSAKHSASPIWSTQLEFVLACTNRVGMELFAQCRASNHLRKFPDCLKRLRSALLALGRQSSSTEGAPNIQIEHRSGACALCGRPQAELLSEALSES